MCLNVCRSIVFCARILQARLWEITSAQDLPIGLGNYGNGLGNLKVGKVMGNNLSLGFVELY
jgi:hypothetical protein